MTLVLPAYNAERTLGRAIDSAKAQRLQPTEILVVDDGSSDDTVEVGERHGAKVIRHDGNRGLAAARSGVGRERAAATVFSGSTAASTAVGTGS